MEYYLAVGRQGIVEYWDLTHQSIIPNFKYFILSFLKLILPSLHYSFLSRLCKVVIFCANFTWIILF